MKDHIPDLSYVTKAQDFYDKHASAISSGAQKIGKAIDMNDLEKKVKGFSESSKVLMNVLDEIRVVHPFIGGEFFSSSQYLRHLCDDPTYHSGRSGV